MSAKAIDASFFGEQPDVPGSVARASDESSTHPERLGAMLQTLFSTRSHPELVADILGAAGDVDSALPAQALWALGRVVRASPGLSATFDAGLDGLADRLRRDHPDFAAEFDAFLFEFGCRGPQEWEVRSAVWEVDDGAPLAAIDRLRLACA